nr:hypothetical protein [uncultured Fretibacterium sp.]
MFLVMGGMSKRMIKTKPVIKIYLRNPKGMQEKKIKTLPIIKRMLTQRTKNGRGTLGMLPGREGLRRGMISPVLFLVPIRKTWPIAPGRHPKNVRVGGAGVPRDIRSVMKKFPSWTKRMRRVIVISIPVSISMMKLWG